MEPELRSLTPQGESFTMSQFTIEEIYGINRAQYCYYTGIPPEEMARHLDSEVFILKTNLAYLQEEYKNGGAFTADDQRRRLKLIQLVTDKITSKTAKIKDIKREFGLGS